MAFVFFTPGTLRDGDLELRLRHTAAPDDELGWVPAYMFDMFRKGFEGRIGAIDLRIGNTPGIVLYGGHIGYSVNEEHRGHRYAARAVRLLFPLARRHEINPLWITCNPDNWASRRTCELAGGELVEIVDLPPDNDMYIDGERWKCRYRFNLDRMGDYTPGQFKNECRIVGDILAPVEPMDEYGPDSEI